MITILPSLEDFKISFSDVECEIKLLFSIYADLKCLLNNFDKCQPNPNVFANTNMQEHVPCAFAH